MSELAMRGAPFTRTRPRISLVVAWQGCSDELSRRLHLWERWVENGTDVVVVCSCPPAERERIARTHPGVRLVAANASDDIAALRELGVSAARGDIVVIIDDRVGWNSSWRDRPPVAVGREHATAGERVLAFAGSMLRDTIDVSGQ